jgi:hypothetical protein
VSSDEAAVFVERLVELRDDVRSDDVAAGRANAGATAGTAAVPAPPDAVPPMIGSTDLGPSAWATIDDPDTGSSAVAPPSVIAASAGDPAARSAAIACPRGALVAATEGDPSGDPGRAGTRA